MTHISQRFKLFAEEFANLPLGGKESQLIKDGGWTIGQVVHHITDATLMYLSRVMLVLSSEKPTLVPFDQDILASYSFSSDIPSISTIEQPLLTSLCNKFSFILDKLSEEQMGKLGYHPEIGEISLKNLATRCIEHNESHLQQIRNVLQY